MKRMIEFMSPNNPSPKSFYLSSSSKEAPLGVQASTSEDEGFRVPRIELELAYLKHSLTFNAINRNVQTILTTRERLVHPNPEVVKYFTNFLADIGTRGSQLTWRELKEIIFRYQLIYGPQFTELIHDKSGKEILDLDSIDPKQMDYAKSNGTTIVMDKNDNPIGYVQTVPQEYTQDMNPAVKVPEGVTLEGNQIFIPASRIAQFKFWTIGPGFYRIGLIEPAYESVKTVLLLNKDYAKRAHTILFPTRVATVGDENHEPSPEKVRNISNNMKKATAATEIAIPYHVKMAIMESKNPDSMKTFLEYFNQSVIEASGVPAPYATGQGKNTNKATLQKLNQMFEMGLKDYVERTCRSIEHNIFRPIALKNGIPGYPRIQIGPIGVDERSEKYKRLIGYIKEGVFKPEELHKYIAEMEDIDL